MNNTTIAAFPTASILGLLFIALKLTGHIAWSWWWVLAPFWVPFTLGFVIVGAYLTTFLVIAVITLFSRK